MELSGNEVDTEVVEAEPEEASPHCQIGSEISDYTGDKISVGVARPSHVLGQSVPHEG